jgi:hypothetical protein
MIFIVTTKIKWLNDSSAYSWTLSWGDVILSSAYFTISLFITDVILQSIIYFTLRKRLTVFKTGNKFVIGVVLHFITLILYSRAMDVGDFWTGNIIAMSLSTVISGIVYYFLNSEKIIAPKRITSSK